MKRFFLGVATVAGLFLASSQAWSADKLLNASYDVGRELFAQVNKAFIAGHPGVSIDQSHAGTSAQARAIAEGLGADVVTFNQVIDIDFLVKKGLVSADWQKDFPDDASPFYSLPSFLVRAGNPKHIKDWNDLVRDGVQVISPSPKTSGGARWNYLAAWGYALKQPGGDDAKAREFVTKLYKNVPVLDSGARGATTTFVERKIGDVLITWENEAILSVHEFAKDELVLVVPSISVLTEPPVTVVDKNVDKHGTRALAEEYLRFLYTPEGQEVCAKNYYRPRDAAVLAKHKQTFPDIQLFTVDELFGGWAKAQPTHFNDGGVFDQIYQPKK